MPSKQSVLTLSLLKLLNPLVKLLLRNGIACDAACELVKSVYIEVAKNDFAIPGKKQTISRISTLTGLPRKDISKLIDNENPDIESLNQKYNRAARVITGWARDSDFQNKNGQPKDLELENGENDFKTLVKKYSGDIPPRAIRDELLRVNLVEITKLGKLRLVQRAYLPNDDTERLAILGTDVSALIQTIAHNVSDKNEKPLFQRKVAYTSIPIESLDIVRTQLSNKAQSCLEQLDKLLLKHDSDTNPKIQSKGRCHAGVGIYYFEEKNENK